MSAVWTVPTEFKGTKTAPQNAPPDRLQGGNFLIDHSGQIVASKQPEPSISSKPKTPGAPSKPTDLGAPSMHPLLGAWVGNHTPQPARKPQATPIGAGQ
jgi:hypothetical protein